LEKFPIKKHDFPQVAKTPYQQSHFQLHKKEGSMPPLQIPPLNLRTPIHINKKGQDFELISSINVERN
jgi:hypothetical protein